MLFLRIANFIYSRRLQTKNRVALYKLVSCVFLNKHFPSNTSKQLPWIYWPTVCCQRGRDHGTAGINAYRKYFGLRPYHNFNQFWDCAVDLRTLYRCVHCNSLQRIVMSHLVWKLVPYFSMLYSHLSCVFNSHPDDVDLFTGGTCERSVKKGIVGETFAHILGQQFHDLKFGDKYFFETSDQRYGFTTGTIGSQSVTRTSHF